MPRPDCAGAGLRPARHCEAPVSTRYVQCYRCEAIQCRGDNIRTTYRRTTTSTLDCFAAFHRYVSQVRWRLRKDGQGEALPCPGAMRRDVGRSYVRARRGEPPRRFAVRSLPRGEFTGEGGFETRPYVSPSKPIPLLGGVPPAGGGVVPAPCAA
ncbi:MAG: hypothetical protein LBM98_02085 [Oscillospiraceae bacterium]|nr:hypothetical protein [Oscillospiraceae bacterium]